MDMSPQYTAHQHIIFSILLFVFVFGM